MHTCPAAAAATKTLTHTHSIIICTIRPCSLAKFCSNLHHSIINIQYRQCQVCTVPKEFPIPFCLLLPWMTLRVLHVPEPSSSEISTAACCMRKHSGYGMTQSLRSRGVLFSFEMLCVPPKADVVVEEPWSMEIGSTVVPLKSVSL